MTQEQHIASIDCRKIVPSINGAILSAADMVYLGLQLLEESNIKELKVPQGRCTILWPENHTYDMDKLKEDFKAWVIGNALVKSLEAISRILEQIISISKLYKASKDGKIRYADLQDAIKNDPKISKLNLTRKLNLLKDHGFPITDEVYYILISLDRTRNCLVHRNGIVSFEADIKGNNYKDKMLVEWLKPGLLAESSDGKQRRVEIGSGKDSIVNPGDKLYQGIDFKQVSKPFKADERITISASEYGEISLTLLRCSAVLGKSMDEHAINHGININPKE